MVICEQVDKLTSHFYNFTGPFQPKKLKLLIGGLKNLVAKVGSHMQNLIYRMRLGLMLKWLLKSTEMCPTSAAN